MKDKTKPKHESLNKATPTVSKQHTKRKTPQKFTRNLCLYSESTSPEAKQGKTFCKAVGRPPASVYCATLCRFPTSLSVFLAAQRQNTLHSEFFYCVFVRDGFPKSHKTWEGFLAFRKEQSGCSIEQRTTLSWCRKQRIKSREPQRARERCFVE